MEMMHGSTDTDEHEIISAVTDGRQDGYAAMMRRYGGRVYGFIARTVTDPQDVEELVQDTFVRAFRYADSYDARKASLPTWLLQIAYNVVRSHAAKRRLPTVSIGIPECDDVCDHDRSEPLFATGDNRLIEMLEEAVASLPLEDRTLLLLYYYDNRSIHEIAGIMDEKTSTLTSRLYRIRIRLHQMIEKRKTIENKSYRDERRTTHDRP